jgi:hypothetical protein
MERCAYTNCASKDGMADPSKHICNACGKAVHSSGLGCSVDSNEDADFSLRIKQTCLECYKSLGRTVSGKDDTAFYLNKKPAARPPVHTIDLSSGQSPLSKVTESSTKQHLVYSSAARPSFIVAGRDITIAHPTWKGNCVVPSSLKTSTWWKAYHEGKHRKTKF